MDHRSSTADEIGPMTRNHDRRLNSTVRHAHDFYGRKKKVKQPKLKWMMLIFALGAIMMLGACKKKVAPPPPPPPPPPAAPTPSLTPNPNTIDKGQSTPLTWEPSNATHVSIECVGGE